MAKTVESAPPLTFQRVLRTHCPNLRPECAHKPLCHDILFTTIVLCLAWTPATSCTTHQSKVALHSRMTALQLNLVYKAQVTRAARDLRETRVTLTSPHLISYFTCKQMHHVYNNKTSHKTVTPHSKRTLHKTTKRNTSP